MSERRAVYQFSHADETTVLRTEVQELRAEVQALRAAQQDEKLYVERSLLVEIVDEVIGVWVQKLPQPAQSIAPQQPIINVNVDTGALSQALLLGNKLLVDELAKSFTEVLREVVGRIEKIPTHAEKDVPVSEDDLYEVGGVKYLKNNSQTRVSGHTQTQVKRANKAKGGGVSYTPDTLCLDTGFRQCVEAGMSKSKLAAKFGVSESTVARAKRMLKKNVVELHEKW